MGMTRAAFIATDSRAEPAAKALNSLANSDTTQYCHRGV